MAPFQVTVASILTISVLDSILALLLCLLFRNRRVAMKIGPGCMLAILLAVVIRTFFPLEFWYTKAVFIEDVFEDLLGMLLYPVWNFGGFELLVQHCLIGIWLLGILTTLGLWYRSYRNYAVSLAGINPVGAAATLATLQWIRSHSNPINLGGDSALRVSVYKAIWAIL